MHAEYPYGAFVYIIYDGRGVSSLVDMWMDRLGGSEWCGSVKRVYTGRFISEIEFEAENH